MTRFAFVLVSLTGCLADPIVAVDKPAVDVPRGAGTDVTITLDGQPLTLAEVAWLVDDPRIASIGVTSDGERLRILGVHEGATTVHVGSRGQTIDIPTRVSSPAIVQMWIEPTQVATSIGLAVPVTATAIDTTNTIRDVTSQVQWEVADPAIAHLERDIVQGARSGQTQLHALLGTTSVAVPVTVY